MVNAVQELDNPMVAALRPTARLLITLPVGFHQMAAGRG